MASATLTFNLAEEQSDFDRAVNAGMICSAIYTFDQDLRSRVKYDQPDNNTDEKMAEIKRETFREAREILWAILTNHGVALDLLIG